MSIKTVKYTLPDFLASALINNDRTGLDDDEIDFLEDWIAEKIDQHGGLFHCLTVEQYGYCESSQNDYHNLAGDCSIYTFHVLEV